jgi:hypothetical protein
MIDQQTFIETITLPSVPSGLSIYLEALWYDAKGEWNKAHKLIDHLEDKDAAWLHAYLHRKEGDISNADYWYSKAGKRRPLINLKEEWENLVSYFTK